MGSRSWRWFSPIFLALLCWAGLASARAAPLAQLVAVSPQTGCASLSAADISPAVGASTRITSATPVADAKPAAYCDVHGTIAPQIGFEVRLPLTTWTQRFLQTGCGGFCGSLGIRVENASGCVPATHGELVLAATDMGHTGGMSDASAMTDAQTRIDFAYRAQHLTTLAAKALMKKFYGQAPRYSYFSGCSDGGREALMEAQRYPDDFEGIIAGDPASNFISQNTFGSAWAAYVNVGPDGKAIFTADRLVLLHNAVLAQCGDKTGLVDDPLSCHFDANSIVCKPGQNSSTCLSAAEAKVVNEIYQGPEDAAGDRLAPGGMLPGSEANWAGPVVPPKGQLPGGTDMANSAYKYLAFSQVLPGNVTSADLKFTKTAFEETTKLSRLYDATDPDLSAFKAHGGKLILYHGLADPAISPINTIYYYTRVQQTMGTDAAEQFTRLYLFPGVGHCGGGQGPFNPDFLSAIMGWVEGGQAPSAIQSARYATDMKVVIGVPPGQGGQGGQRPKGGPGGPGGPNTRRPDMDLTPPGKPEMTRPVYAYPATAQYTGTGAATDAANYTSAPGTVASSSLLNWLGSPQYTAKHFVWCTASGTKLNCKPKT